MDTVAHFKYFFIKNKYLWFHTNDISHILLKGKELPLLFRSQVFCGRGKVLTSRDNWFAEDPAVFCLPL